MNGILAAIINARGDDVEIMPRHLRDVARGIMRCSDDARPVAFEGQFWTGGGVDVALPRSAREISAEPEHEGGVDLRWKGGSIRTRTCHIRCADEPMGALQVHVAGLLRSGESYLLSLRWYGLVWACDLTLPSEMRDTECPCVRCQAARIKGERREAA